MKDKLSKGVLWLGSAKALINLLGLASTLLLARLLTPEDFGLVALATIMLSIISALTELSLSSALIQHKAPTEAHFHTAWTLNFCRSALIGLIFCGAAPMAAKIYGEPRLVNLMLVLGGSASIAGFSNPKTVLLTRSLIFWQEFVLTVSQKLVAFLVSATIAIIYNSYWALVGGLVASQLVGIVISYVIVPFKPQFAVSRARELWSFSVWLMFGQVVQIMNVRLDSLLVGSYFGRPALGFYSVGDNLAGMPTRELIGPLEATLFPGFARIAGEKARLAAAYRTAQALMSAVALPAGIGCALIAHPLVLLAMGAKWLPVVEIIQVLACVFAAQTLIAPALPLAMAMGETKLLFHRDLLNFGIRVPLIVLGMVSMGFQGIIYARALSTVIGIIVSMLLVRRLIGTELLQQLGANKRSIISIGVMVAGMLTLEHLMVLDESPLSLIYQLFIFVVFGVILYVGTCLFLWLVEKKPIGPEKEIMRLATGAISMLSRRR